MKMRWLMSVLGCLIFWACKDDTPSEMEPETNISKISVGTAGQIQDSDGSLFFPWGLNYTNPDGVGLIEDNWYDQNIWNTIKSDFLEMKALSANVVRIHLQYHRFMIDATTPDVQALDRLEDLVAYAEEQNMYLDVTGLAAYRASDQPAYYKEMTDQERWDTQKLFWKNIAARIGDSPAVFAFNLMNEPVVSVGCAEGTECGWLPGAGLGGFNFVQNISRDPDKEFVPTIKEWILEMTTAIRSEDNATLITVGFLNLGDISQFANDLDYISVHVYPESGMVDASIEYVKNNQSDVALVIEETSNFKCNISELETFVNGLENNYDGLMGHYFGKTINELDETIIVDALHKNFLEFFVDRNPN